MMSACWSLSPPKILAMSEAETILERLRGEGELDGCVAYLLAFIERSQRGVIK